MAKLNVQEFYRAIKGNDRSELNELVKAIEEIRRYRRRRGRRRSRGCDARRQAFFVQRPDKLWSEQIPVISRTRITGITAERSERPCWAKPKAVKEDASRRANAIKAKLEEAGFVELK